MDHFFHLEGVAAALAIIAFAWAVLKWIVEAAATLRSTRTVVEYLYTNHIPHIENALRKLCSRSGIDYEEPPPPPIAGL